MKKFGLLFLCAFLPLGGGCAPVLIATGAVAGYAVSRDSVVMDLDKSWDDVWNAAQEEVGEQGQVKRENRERGRLDARIEETDVVVIIKQLTPSTVRVAVRARKYLLPKVDVAQRVALGIRERL